MHVWHVRQLRLSTKLTLKRWITIVYRSQMENVRRGETYQLEHFLILISSQKWEQEALPKLR
jgi:hypothetical protein